MKSLDKIIYKSFTGKRWINLGNFCNGKNHPISLNYRAYRRGLVRCKTCGAKLGKVKCERKSSTDMLVDNIYQENPLFKLLSLKPQRSEE